MTQEFVCICQPIPLLLDPEANEVVIALALVKLYNLSCIHHSECDQNSLSKYEMNWIIMV
jgi:hypothetical protein